MTKTTTRRRTKARPTTTAADLAYCAISAAVAIATAVLANFIV